MQKNSFKIKNKPVHPQILKIMSRPQNAPKPVSSQDVAMVNTISNIKSAKSIEQKQQQQLKSQNQEKDEQLQKQLFKDMNNGNKKKSFSMNFSQLSTGKPCGSCGGR